MTMTVEMFTMLLERKMGIQLQVKQSELMPDYLRVIVGKKVSFLPKQQKILKQYCSPGSITDVYCYHILVGAELLNEGIMRW